MRVLVPHNSFEDRCMADHGAARSGCDGVDLLGMRRVAVLAVVVHPNY